MSYRATFNAPVGLMLVDVPGLGGTWIHQRMAPLPEVIEELIGFPDHLSKKATFVDVRDELFQDDAFNAHTFRFAPCARTKSCTA